MRPALSGVIVTYMTVVLPFSVEGPRDAQDQAFAQLLAHDLTAHLARYDLRMISHRTADLYRDRVDVAKVGAELGVPYAIVGRIQRNAGGVRAEVQLIEAATRVTLWSDQVQREPGEPATLADEVARGFARPVLINIASAEARRLRRDPDRPVEVSDLLLRAQKLTIQAERARLYRQAEQMLHDDVGRLFIANNQPPLAFSKRAKGYVPHPTGSEYFNTVEVQ